MNFKIIALGFCLLILNSCKEISKEIVKQDKEESVALETEISKSTFEDVAGKPIELSDYKGKRVLVNFWATWCRPCIEEMPSLLEAQAALTNENYVFLLASDQSIDKIKAFIEKKGFDFNFIKFNGAMSDFNINALPATFIYNEEGEMVQRIDGATEWNDPEILTSLKTIK